ncbi:FkbM family methyltransferase [Flagellimonas hymeniacidonis]|nr:FkbM family methyltransferase [Flagellimonas hymeniacidonis]
MRLLLNLYRYIKTFGRRGIVIFFKIKFNKTERVFLPNSDIPLKLRSRTSDIPTFRHIFMEKQYHISLDFKPQFIVDAGANIGLAAIYFINKHPHSKMVCIEPEDSNFELLQKNIKEYPNITALKKALSSINDQEINLIDSGHGKWGFMTELAKESRENTGGLLRTISVDEIMKQNDLETIDILKIDIEGAEKELFESNTENWLPKTRCLIIELHDRKKAGCSTSLFRAISKYDFSFSHKGENLIFINNDF